MSVARIILKGQVFCGKVVGVYPNGSTAEGTTLIALRHVVEGSIPIDKNHIFPGVTLTQQGQIWAGNHKLFPVDTFTNMNNCGSDIGKSSRVCFDRLLVSNAVQRSFHRGKAGGMAGHIYIEMDGSFFQFLILPLRQSVPKSTKRIFGGHI